MGSMRGAGGGRSMKSSWALAWEWFKSGLWSETTRDHLGFKPWLSHPQFSDHK